MTQPILISTIIPCYNSERYLLRCIKSVMAQTYSNIEIVIVDDGSTDKTSEIAKSVNDTRIVYYYKKNGGLSSARNYGMERAKGDMIAFLDSDDFWLDIKLEKQLSLIDTCDIIYSDYTTIASNQKVVPNKVIRKSKVTKEALKRELLSGNVIKGSGSGVIMKRKIIEQIGLFNESLRYAEDWDYWARVAWNDFTFGYINEKLVVIQLHATSMQSATNKVVIKNTIQVILKSFLGFAGLKKYDKSIIYKRLVFNSYSQYSNFKELLSFFIKSIKYDKARLIDFKMLFLILKYYPRDLWNHLKRATT